MEVNRTNAEEQAFVAYTSAAAVSVLKQIRAKRNYGATAAARLAVAVDHHLKTHGSVRIQDTEDGVLVTATVGVLVADDGEETHVRCAKLPGDIVTYGGEQHGQTDDRLRPGTPG